MALALERARGKGTPAKAKKKARSKPGLCAGGLAVQDGRFIWHDEGVLAT